MPDYGLLMGLAQGLQSGADSYQQAKQQQADRKQKNLGLLLQARGQGLIPQQDEAGQVTGFGEDPSLMPFKKSQALQKQEEVAEFDEKSPTSLKQAQNDEDILKTSGVNPDMAHKLTYGKSAHELKSGLLASLMGYQSRGLGTAPANQRNEETQNKNASQVGDEYEQDPIIKNSKIKLNSIAQSSRILVNPNKPVSAKDYRAAFQDYLAATTPGGNPTEGKAHREMPDPMILKINDVLGNLGDNTDLRSTETGRELISLLQENSRSSQHELGEQIAAQAESRYNNYLNSTNQKVQETNKRKLQQYAPKRYAHLVEGKPEEQEPEAAPAPAGLMVKDVGGVKYEKRADGKWYEAGK